MTGNISLIDLGGSTIVNANVKVASTTPPSNPFNIKQGEIKMADVDSTVLANGHTVLANEIAGVRHDIGLAEANVRDSIGQHSGLINKNVGDNGFRIAAAEANVRDKIGETEGRLAKGIGDNRYTIATEAGALGKQIGAEACAINKNIGDARREGAEHTADIRYDVATRAGDIRHELEAGFCNTNKTILQEGQDNMIATKDARHDVLMKIDQTGDRVTDRVEESKDAILARTWDLGRDVVDNKTQLTALGYQVRDGFVAAAKDMEIQALRTQQVVVADGDRTRALINDLKYHDLNRGLVERNAELVECEADRRYWRHHAEQNQFAGQWAALQSQIQAFASQLQETRQGMVNFGTMAGVGQSSTSNNVR